MSRRRKGRAVSGILLLDKAKGVTSNFALQQCKRLYQAAKAGHTGSLDPMATGVLPLCFGEATKFSQYLLDADKGYTATIRLGEKTTTADAEGEVLATAALPAVTESHVQAVLARFEGDIEQIPPMYSALKKDGQPLYKLARKGISVERKARQIKIFSLKLLGFNGSDLLEIEVHCSKGTYIRVLAEEIAEALGTVGHLTALRRTRVGGFELADCHSQASLSALNTETGVENLDSLLISPEKAVNHLPLVELKDGEGYYVRLGQAVFVPNSPLSGLVRIREGKDSFLGIGEVLDDGRIGPRRLIAAV